MATTVIGRHRSERWGPTLVVSEMQGDLGIICEKTKRYVRVRHNNQYFSLQFVFEALTM